jgi:hypothetical protein
VTASAAAHGHFAVEVADLAAVNLPMFNEPRHPPATAMLDDLGRVDEVLRPLREPEAPEPAEPETGDLDPEAGPVR